MHEVARTFWFAKEGGALFLVPDGSTLLDGELELQNLRGERARVDPERMAPWRVDQSAVTEHLRAEVSRWLPELQERLAARSPGAPSRDVAPPPPPEEVARRLEAAAGRVEAAAARFAQALRAGASRLREPG